MNEAQASVLRTAVKCAALIILFNGWPKIRKTSVFNQTVIQPSEAEDMVMRSVILELRAEQPSEKYVYFERLIDVVEKEDLRTDEYAMLRHDWHKNGRPGSISITISSLVDGVNV